MTNNPRRRRWRLLLLSVVIVMVSTLPTFLMGATFFEMGPELGIGPLGLGLLTGLFFLTAALSSPFLGRWVERVGWQRSMRINVVVTAIVAGVIPAVVNDALTLGALLVVSGVIYGSSNPAANQALARNTSPGRTALVFGIKHAGIPASTLVAGLAVPAIVVASGWRAAYMMAAVLAVSAWFLIPSDPDAEPARTGEHVSGRRWTVSELRTLAVVAAMGAVAANALGTFLVSAAIDADMTEIGAGWLQFGGSGASIAARVVSGWIADHRGRPIAGIVALMGSGAAIFATLTFAAGAWFAVVVVLAYATGWGWPGLMTAAVVGSDRSTAASSSSITQAGVFVGAGGGPLFLGLVVEYQSYDMMWWIVAGALTLSALLARSVGLRRDRIDGG